MKIIATTNKLHSFFGVNLAQQFKSFKLQMYVCLKSFLKSKNLGTHKSVILGNNKDIYRN